MVDRRRRLMVGGRLHGIIGVDLKGHLEEAGLFLGGSQYVDALDEKAGDGEPIPYLNFNRTMDSPP